jgi:hypothetical protein
MRLFLPLLAVAASAEDPSPQPPKADPPPITTAKSAAADLLRAWWAEGTAAGNAGDHYDNRDRGHSLFATAEWPQLAVITYSKEEQEKKADWGLAQASRHQVVLGNSSTAAGIVEGGSNTRQYYDDPEGLPFLYQLYTTCDLHVYPCHLDFRPGHGLAGRATGVGDCFPTNTPYLITSYGSSWSDQPFLGAIAATLASFRPEVKRRLIETGLLMPTMQALLRGTLKPAPGPEDYFSGKAHPCVFHGEWLDPVAMVKLAHEMTVDAIPPMVIMRVVSEDEPTAGPESAEPGRTEKLADTPAAIARVWRSTAYARTITVSAAGSFDLQDRPLSFRWSLLQGDAKHVRIAPSEDGRTATISLDYPARRPVPDDPGIDSNRVDIGVFAGNGTSWSAPGFITVWALDDEARTYDEAGRLLELGQGAGETSFTIDWTKLFALLGDDHAPSLLRDALSSEQFEAMLDVGDEYAAAAALIPMAKKQEEATAHANEVVQRHRPPLGGSAEALVQGILRRWRDDSGFLTKHAAVLLPLCDAADRADAFAKAAKRLADYGVAQVDGLKVEPQPLRAGSLTAYERCLGARFNAELIAGVLYPGVVNARYDAYYVDRRLATVKTWRDVFRYDADGKRIGGTRYDGKGGVTELGPAPAPRRADPPAR